MAGSVPTEQRAEDALPFLSANDERKVYDRAASDALFYAGMGVAMTYFVLTIGHAIAVPPAYRTPMVAFALLGFIGSGAVAVYCHRRTPPIWLAHPLCLWLIGILALNSALHLGLSGEIKHTSNLAFAVVAVGCLFLSREWWAVAVTGIVGTWAVVTYQRVSAPDWTHYGFMQIIALCLSGTVLEVRRRGVLLNGRLRLADAIRLKELEAALHEVKLLEGLIPICAWCKKVRDDTGFWDEVESYIANRTSASFTHGLCPTCEDKHFRNTPSLERSQHVVK